MNPSRVIQIYRKLWRFRRLVGASSKGFRDLSLKRTFDSGSNSAVPLLESFSVKLSTLVATVKNQPLFLRSDPLASVVAAFGTNRWSGLLSSSFAELSSHPFAKSHIVLRSYIVSFCNCGELGVSRQILRQLPSSAKTAFLYNTLLKEYHEQSGVAVVKDVRTLLREMESDKIKPERNTVKLVIQLASEWKSGDLAQTACKLADQTGATTDLLVPLVQMCARTGMAAEALRYFQRIPVQKRDVVAYSSLILACSADAVAVKHVRGIVEDMIKNRVDPNQVTVLAIIRASSISADIDLGERAWGIAQQIGIDNEVVVLSAMVGMFGKCRLPERATAAFNDIPAERVDLIACSSIIQALAEFPEYHSFLSTVLKIMEERGFRHNSISVLGIVKAAACGGDSKLAEFAWEQVQKCQLHKYVSVLSALVYMYGKCGNPAMAQTVFDQIPPAQRDTVSYTSLILAHDRDSESAKRVPSIYERMIASSVPRDRVTVLALLRAAAVSKDFELGERAVSEVVAANQALDTDVVCAYIDMYGKCEQPKRARELFDQIPDHKRTVVAYNSLILALSFDPESAATVPDIFDEMIVQNSTPDKITILGLLGAAAMSSRLSLGERAIEHGNLLGLCQGIEVQNAIIDMFGKCGAHLRAIEAFNSIPVQRRDVVSYNALLYALSSDRSFALRASKYLEVMIDSNVAPDMVTIMSLLRCAAVSNNISLGVRAIELAATHGLSSSQEVVTAIISFYGKCWRVSEAREWFSQLESPSVVAYASIIGALAYHGLGKEALVLYNQALSENVGCNEGLAVVILQALSHAYMIIDAIRVYSEFPISLRNNDRVISSLIDCYCRVGRLSEAETLLSSISTPSVIPLLCVLGGCRLARDDVRAGRIFDQIVRLDPSCTPAHIMFANTLASVGKIAESEQVHAMIRAKGLKKIAGESVVFVEGIPTSFYTHHIDHENIEGIMHRMKLHDDMLQADLHLPDLSCVTDPLCKTDEQKAQSLCEHSERYALAYADMMLPAGVDIDIVSNLRVCGNCHDVLKRLSRLLNRTIYLRDSSRYHCFAKGACDCNDHW